MKKSASNVVWGIVIILVGVALILNATGVIGNLFFDGWWSLFLIVPGLALVFKRGGRVVGCLLVAFGVYFLLKAQNIIHFTITWPLILGIAVFCAGIQILISARNKQTYTQQTADGTQPQPEPVNVPRNGVDFNKSPEYVAVLTSVNAANACQELVRCEATGVLGSVKLDLARAGIQPGARLELTGVFGSVEVNLPSNVCCEIYGTPVLGSVNTHFTPVNDPNLPRFRIDATAVFGSVDLYREA